jgi:hypothetical protein
LRFLRAVHNLPRNERVHTMKRNFPENKALVDRQQATEPREPAEPSERPHFERPRVRRLGKLPAVTTAFGGSFDP